jgi:hypothetical protein
LPLSWKENAGQNKTTTLEGMTVAIRQVWSPEKAPAKSFILQGDAASLSFVPVWAARSQLLIEIWARHSLKGERSGSRIPKLGSLFKPCLSILKRQMRPVL